MVTYGPLVQDSDYAPTWSISTGNPANYVQVIERQDIETPFQDPVYPIIDDDVKRVFMSAQEALSAFGGMGGWVEWLNSGYNASHPNWKSGWGTQIWRRTFPVVNREHFYHPIGHGAVAPEGAIGLVFDGHSYDPEDPWSFGVVVAGENLALRLMSTMEFEGQFEDGRVSPAAPLPWVAATILVLTVGGGSVDLASLHSPANDTAGNWLLRNLGDAIDLTPFGALEPGWSAAFHTESRDPIVGGDPGPFEDTFTKYGWLINILKLEADVRPPLYRWVYDSTTAPYRRIFPPRADGLSGGAPRNYPPSNTVQTGNRNFGGIL